MTPEERQAWRWAYAKDPHVVMESLIHDYHALEAACRLLKDGITSDLKRQLQRIGEAAK